MNYVKFRFTVITSQEEAIRNALQKIRAITYDYHILSYRRRLMFEYNGNSIQQRTQRQRYSGQTLISKSPSRRSLKRSIGTITARFAPKILKVALAVLGTLGLIAVSGAISGATKKPTSSDGVTLEKKGRDKAGWFFSTLLAGLAAPLTASALGTGGEASKASKKD